MTFLLWGGGGTCTIINTSVISVQLYIRLTRCN